MLEYISSLVQWVTYINVVVTSNILLTSVQKSLWSLDIFWQLFHIYVFIHSDNFYSFN